MNFLDWCLIVLALAYAVSGYWQGFIAGAFATTGLLLGGFVGIWLAPMLLGDAAPSLWVSLGALFVVLLTASVGQAVFQFAGTRIRSRISWQPIRALDAVGGAVLCVVAVLLVAWMLGVAISGSRLPGISPQVRDSRVLVAVNDVMPAQAQRALRSFDDVVGSSFFPRYLEPFARERIVEVAPADRKVLRDPDIQRASRSVFKIRSSNRCGAGVEGTGFLYAPGKLMTNAHVVAGVTEPLVQVGEKTVRGTVVHYNPDVDVAVVDVPGLDGPVVRFDLDGKEGQQGAVLGFPRTGPSTPSRCASAATSGCAPRTSRRNGGVTRRVFSLRGPFARATPVGPPLSTEGRVLGVASPRRSATARPATPSPPTRSAAAARGLEGEERVSSGNCA